MLNLLPALSKFYPGMMPWHLDRMTLREVLRYKQFMDESLAQ